MYEYETIYEKLFFFNIDRHDKHDNWWTPAP